MPLRPTIALLLAAGLIHAGAAPARADADAARPAPYVLKGTAVHLLRDPSSGRDYEIAVSLPQPYDATRLYPVLVVADADYAFPLVRSIARRVRNGGRNLDDFILVGLGYAVGDTPEYSRRRDYTPTRDGSPDAVSDMPGRQPEFGGAEAHRRFLAGRVLPFIEKHYRADPRRRIFAGHSYGSLFGAHVLLTSPELFQHYLLSSPSLWFGKRAVFAAEERYAAAHRDLPARVYLTIGGYETLRPGSKDPRYNKENDMVADLRSFERALKSRRYPGLAVESHVLEGEDHLTVNPVSYTRGLLWALAPRAQQ